MNVIRAIDIADLYSVEQRRIQRLIRRLVRNGATADDLVQQAFEKLLASDGTHIKNWPAYLACTARHLALNHLRNESRRMEVSNADQELEALKDASPSPETIAIYRCELRRILTAVAGLPPRRREAFVLNKFEDLTYDEIAARQGVSRNTVISHIVIALADLDRVLGQE